MCNKVVEEFPFLLEDVPDNLKDAGEGGRVMGECVT